MEITCDPRALSSWEKCHLLRQLAEARGQEGAVSSQLWSGHSGLSSSCESHALLTLSLPIRGGSHRDSAAPRDCRPCGGIGAGSHVLTVGVGGPVHAGHSDPSTGAIPKFTDSLGEQRHTPDSRT